MNASVIADRLNHTEKAKEVNGLPNPQKNKAVEQIKEKLARAKSIVVSDYRGLTVGEMTNLRNKLRKEGVEMKVVKNRLAKIALRESGFNTMDEHLKGTKALAFGMADPIGPAKVLMAYAKDNEKLKVVAGLMDNCLLDIAAISELAKLPSRDVLLARLLGSLSSPIQKLAIGLHQTVAKIVYALDAVARKKADQQQPDAAT
ncbi:MAG: 50S ribosomal protein L10 [Candidatus Sumerlaeota bacterium]|nr:50S ribosomal protein L10 [Candidatus Sumerlaeota bacterium]